MSTMLSITIGVICTAILAVPLHRTAKTIERLSGDYLTALSSLLFYGCVLGVFGLLAQALEDHTAAFTAGQLVAIFCYPLCVSKVYKCTMKTAGELTWNAAFSWCGIIACFVSAFLYISFVSLS